MLTWFSRGRDERVEALAEVPLFQDCSRHELERLARLADETRFPAGATLIREGKVGREVFVLLDGEAAVTMNDGHLATLHAGDIVGEMAIIEHEPRTATVIASSDVRALVLTNQGFNAMLDVSPAVARRVMTTIAQRLRDVQAA